jgi:hypothetical protein
VARSRSASATLGGHGFLRGAAHAAQRLLEPLRLGVAPLALGLEILPQPARELLRVVQLRSEPLGLLARRRKVGMQADSIGRRHGGRLPPADPELAPTSPLGARRRKRDDELLAELEGRAVERAGRAGPRERRPPSSPAEPAQPAAGLGPGVRYGTESIGAVTPSYDEHRFLERGLRQVREPTGDLEEIRCGPFEPLEGEGRTSGRFRR